MLAVLFLPFALNAQVSLPISMDFENASDLTGWTLVNCNSSTGRATTQHHEGSACFAFHWTTSPNQFLISPEFAPSSGAEVVTFWYYNSSSTYVEEFEVGFSSTTNDTAAFTWGTHVTAPQCPWTEYSVNVPAGTKYVAIKSMAYDAYYLYIDDLYIGMPPTCFKVVNPTVDAVQTTSNSLTLTWVDTINTSATYNIYDMSDSSLVAADVVGTSYTVTGLDANTLYTYGIETNCGGGDFAAGYVVVSGRTACAAMTTLPYTCGFESDELQGTTNATRIPYCWERHSSGTGSYTYFPYSNTSYVHTGGRALYFYTGTSTSYPDTQAVVLPELDINAYPMNGNRITFWSRMSSASYSSKVYVGTVSNNADLTTFTMIDSVQVTGNTHTKYSVPLTNASDAYVVLMVLRNGGGNLVIDDVTLEEMPSCLEISNLSVVDSVTTPNSITLTWEDTQNPDGTTYTVYNMADTSDVYATINGNVAVIENLITNTQYTFGVQANCATGDAPYMTVSARTSCGAQTLPFVENFSTFLTSDPCWRGASNATAAQVFAGTALTLGNPSSWNYTSAIRDGLEGGHIYKNVFGSSVKSWLITPVIDLSDATSAQLSFDVALTDYNSAALPDVDGDTNTSQAFMVIVSADGGNTWLEANATKWQNVGGDYTYASLASTSYQTKVINLNNYVGQNIKIAFYCQSLWSGGDNDLHIDNIAVTEVPTCPAVLGLTVDDIDGTTVSVSWDNNGAEGYEVEVLLNDEAVSDANILVEDTTAVISDLLVDNDYQIHVRSICGSDYGSWSNPVTVHIGYCLPNPTSVDGQGIVGVSFGGMTNTTHPTTAGYANYTSMAGSVPAGTTATVEITYATGYDYGTIIWVDWNNNMVFEGNEVVFAGLSASTNPATLNATFDIPATTELGNYRMRILGADSYFNSNVTSLEAAATANPCASYTWGVAEDYTLTVTDAPSCLAVTDLTVDSVTANSVFLSWTDEINAGATYTIYNMADTSAIVNGVSATEYEVTGLDARTNYTFGVVANCSATDASQFVTVSASTDCAGGSCIFTITGTDQYSDGWNGASINVMQGGSVVGTFSVTGSSNTATYSICSGMPVSFVWISGEYDEECHFTIYDGTDANVFTAYGDEVTGTFFTLADACPSCLPVTDLTVGTTTETSITISWTGTAASYDVYNGEDFVANVTTNTYTFTGLTVATAYTFGVQAICSADDTAALATIDAMTECADITTLPYFEGFENGLGCWSTINGSSDGMPWNILNNASYAHSGSNAAISFSYYSYSSLHANAWLISPKFVLPTVTANDSLTLSWWHRVDGSYPNDLYDVVVSTTTNDTAAFTTLLLAVSPDSISDYVHNMVDLTPYAGQQVYLAFHHHNSYDQDYLLIDDIEIFQGGYVPPAPDTLTVTFAVNDITMGTTIPAPGVYYYVTGDSVFFGSQANPGYEFESWEIIRGTVDTLVLGPQYANNYYVLANSWMQYGNITFIANFEAGTVPVDSLTLHLTINNDALGSITPAPGTYTLALNDTVSLVAIPNPGANFSAWRFFLPGQPVDIPINPFEFVVNDNFFGLGELTIQAIFTDSTSVPDSVTVIVNTADPTMGTTDPVPGTYTFAIGEQSVLTAVPNTGYDFLYWIETMTFAGETFTDTIYTQTVTREFSQLFANWAFEITAYFEPAQVLPCETPTGVHVTSIDAESISLAWDANDNVESWNVRYRVQGTEAWTTEVAYVSTHTINSLTPLTTYEMQVQADCGAGNVSDWTASVVETTVGINNYLESNVNLYPNPAKEYVDVRIDGDMNVTAMEVYDVFGKLINTVSVIENPTRINVSNLANGMYFVRVTTEQGVVTKRFLKK